MGRFPEMLATILAGVLFLPVLLLFSFVMAMTFGAGVVWIAFTVFEWFWSGDQNAVYELVSSFKPYGFWQHAATAWVVMCISMMLRPSVTTKS